MFRWPCILQLRRCALPVKLAGSVHLRAFEQVPRVRLHELEPCCIALGSLTNLCFSFLTYKIVIIIVLISHGSYTD